MSTKKIYEKEHVLKAAISLASRGGLHKISARNVAKELSCSTGPVYQYFSSIEELKLAVLDAARQKLLGYCREHYTDRPFLNMGMGIALFATQNKNLFRVLFLDAKYANESLSFFMESELKVMNLDKRFVALSGDEKLVLLNTILTYSLGLATMISSDMIEKPTKPEIKAKLNTVIQMLIGKALSRELKLDTE